MVNLASAVARENRAISFVARTNIAVHVIERENNNKAFIYSMQGKHCRPCHSSIKIRQSSSIISSSLSIMQRIRGGANNNNCDVNSRNISSSTDDATAWHKAYIAVGSNLGDRYQNIALALSLLAATGSIRIIRTSHLRTTAPMYVTDQPPFLNGAVEISTRLSPWELIRTLKDVERKLGRDVSPTSNAVRFGPRTIDLDILLYDTLIMKEVSTTDDEHGPTTELEIPHPRISEREFVLSPMCDLEGGSNDGITHPVYNKTMSCMLKTLLQDNNRSRNNDKEEDQAIRLLPLPRGRMLLFNETIIMGILNVTPDSFSDGGKYIHSVDTAASEAIQMVIDGAGIIDVGGESTRPGADDITAYEELRRVIPVITRIRELGCDVPISVDTRRTIVARAAVEAGADIVNDVSGGTYDPDMFSTVAALGVPIVLMHMRGNPKTMQSHVNYDDVGGVVDGVAKELLCRSVNAEAAGIPRWLQIIDPGIGFAKDLKGNLSLIRNIDTLRRSCDNLPILFGPSRKGFIGKITGVTNPEDRDYGTISACLASIQYGGDYNYDACNILRVHNVKAMKQATMVYDAIRNA
jgi:dihydropteroate synthase/2-amino-4-hydroxy-6-hydroxymethyldihydropteridine diphosphokinase